jgi:hypothetical protein
MKKILLSLTIVLNFLHANSQEIDPNFTTKKSKELKQFDKAVHGFNFKIGVNTFLTQSLPNEIENTKYDLNDQILDPSSNEAIVVFNDTMGLTGVSYDVPLGFNGSFGYKFKLNNRLFLSTDVYYNMTYINRDFDRNPYSYPINFSKYILRVGSSTSSKSIAIPISAMYQINKKFNFELGLNARYNFSQRRKYYFILDDPILEDWYFFTAKRVKQFGLGLFIGTNFHFNRNLFINLRYYMFDKVIVKPFSSGNWSYFNNTDSNSILWRQFIPYHVLKNQVQLNIGYILPNKD